MENIVIKEVLDKDGSFAYLELHQSGNIIKLSLGDTQMDVQRNNYKWANLKTIIDRISEKVAKQLAESLEYQPGMRSSND